MNTRLGPNRTIWGAWTPRSSQDPGGPSVSSGLPAALCQCIPSRDVARPILTPTPSDPAYHICQGQLRITNGVVRKPLSHDPAGPKSTMGSALARVNTLPSTDVASPIRLKNPPGSPSHPT